MNLIVLESLILNVTQSVPLPAMLLNVVQITTIHAMNRGSRVVTSPAVPVGASAIGPAEVTQNAMSASLASAITKSSGCTGLQ